MSSENVSFGPRETLCPIIAFVAALFSMSPEVHADSFVMTSGKVIDGNVVDGTDISVFIKDKDGLFKSVMITDIAEVRVDLGSGEQIAGQLAGFRDEVYEIVTDKWILYVKDGRVVESLVVHDGEAPSVVPNAGGPAIGIGKQEPAPESDSAKESEMLKRAPL